MEVERVCKLLQDCGECLGQFEYVDDVLSSAEILASWESMVVDVSDDIIDKYVRTRRSESLEFIGWSLLVTP